MGGITYKANTSKGNVFLVDTSSPDYQPGVAPVIVGQDGQTYQGVFVNSVNESGTGAINQYKFPGLPTGMQAKLQYGSFSQDISTSGYYNGDIKGGLKPGSGSGGFGGGGNFGGAQRIGAFGVAPQDLTSQFPKALTTFTDPMTYAKQFGQFNLENLASTNKVASAFALGDLDTELKGLQQFAPGATSLKQAITASDNLVNQASRTAQLGKVMPDVVKDLNQQTLDAATYASGRAPNSVIDAGLSLSDRAAAADSAITGGFGASSSAARSVSDLMSAKDRIALSQYGNQLEQTNAEARANLELAPTEYSNAGQQIQVMPSLSASQLQQSNFQEINNATLISPSTALSSTIQQNQWNTQTLNDFAMSLFNYKVGLANAVAAAGQTSINTGIGLQQQQEAQSTANTQKRATQNANTIGTVIKGGFDLASTIMSFI